MAELQLSDAVCQNAAADSSSSNLTSGSDEKTIIDFSTVADRFRAFIRENGQNACQILCSRCDSLILLPKSSKFVQRSTPDSSIAVLFFVGLVFLYKILRWTLGKFSIRKRTDKYILITGCDSGIGRATCKELDASGCHVIATCLTWSAATELKEELSSRSFILRLDVTEHQDVLNVCEEVKQFLPVSRGLWGLVNNAGLADRNAPSEWLSKADYQHVLDVNLLGLIDVTNTFLPLLKREKGRIVNLSSAVIYLQPANGSTYSLSKAAAHVYTECLRQEVMPFGISVHTLLPGTHQTPLIDYHIQLKNFQRLWDSTSDEMRSQYGQSYFQKCSSKLRLLQYLAQDSRQVTQAISHALFSRFPQNTYLIGWDAWLFFWPSALLPAWLKRRILGVPTPEICNSYNLKYRS